MSDGQILFLVCGPCEQEGAQDFGVKLGERSRVGFYQPVTPESHMRGWLMKHAKCGGRANPDHFKLGYRNPLNHDQVKAKSITDAVKDATLQ